MADYYHLAVYVPSDHLDVVKQALFAAGAGRFGNYEACSFESVGLGQFRPMAAANPAVGAVGDLTQVPEIKLEMLLAGEFVQAVVTALRQAHPYETPAFFLVAVDARCLAGAAAGEIPLLAR